MVGKKLTQCVQLIKFRQKVSDFNHKNPCSTNKTTLLCSALILKSNKQAQPVIFTFFISNFAILALLN